MTYNGADQIAAEQGLGSAGTDAIRAARLFSKRVSETLARRESTLIESTLSGLSTRRLLQLHYNGPEGLTEAARGEGETMEVLDSEAFRTFERVLEAFR